MRIDSKGILTGLLVIAAVLVLLVYISQLTSHTNKLPTPPKLSSAPQVPSPHPKNDPTLSFKPKKSTITTTTDVFADAFVPPGWKGIPISKNNSLYQTPLSVYPEQACNPLFELADTYKDDEMGLSEAFLEHFEEWIPKIGYNNIIDCIVANEKDLKETARHHLGMILTMYAYPKNIPVRHIVEINARNVMHYGPLHGAVWGIVERLPEFATVEDFFQYVTDELCYWHDSNYGVIYVSCIHGIGHGLGERKALPEAIADCSKHPDRDFQYICASGAFMSSEEMSTSGWHPCSKLPFPNVCFRFHAAFWKTVAKYHLYQPCYTEDNAVSLEVTRGCVWGHGFTAPDHSSTQFADQFCRRYYFAPKGSEDLYLNCLDGWFQKAQQVRHSDCEVFKSFISTTPYDLCIYHTIRQINSFNLNEFLWYYYPLFDQAK